MPFAIPDAVSCIQPYVLTATATVASGIIFYLIKVIKDKEKENKMQIASYINDLKEQRNNIFEISDKKTAHVLQDLNNQITKLEVILSKL